MAAFENGSAKKLKPNEETLTLKYFNGRGLMEVPRFLLAIGGKFPGDYVDGRYSGGAEAGEGLESNLGRMPVLCLGDKSIGQSSAINFFLASDLGLMGDSNYEAARIISIQEHVRDMMTAWRNLIPPGTEPDEDKLEKWFNGGPTDSSGPADSAHRDRYLTWYLGRLEQTLDSHGFAVGNKISLADVLIYNALAEHLRDEEAGPNVPQYRREPFTSKARTDAALSKYPKVHASVSVVASHPNVQKWLSIRGVQHF